jgi:tetratricopeptide (TPR) repeat protein
MTDPSVDDLISMAEHKMSDGYLESAIEMLQSQVESRSDHQDDRLPLLLAYGRLLTMAIFYLNGDPLPARRILEEARQIAAAQENDQSLAESLDQIGMTHYYQALAQPEQDFSAAQRYFDEAYELSITASDKRALSETVFHLGLVAQFSGDPDSAHRHFERAAALALEHPVERSFAVRHLGFLASAAGDLASARSYLEESLRLRQSAGYRIGLALAYRSLGDVALQEKRFTEAQENYQQALELSTLLGNRRGMTLCWLSLGEVHEALKRLDEARYAYRIARGFAEEIGHQVAHQIASDRLTALNEAS